MNIKEIEELADHMVAVCVEFHGASPTDPSGYLLWQYIKQMLVDTVNDTVNATWSKHQAAQREVRDFVHQSTVDSAQELKARKDAIEIKQKTADALSELANVGGGGL